MRDAAFVAALCLARAAFGFQFQSLATLGPELTAQFGIGYAALGTLIGLYMLPGIFVALPGGLLGRRYGARLVMGAGLALMCVGGAIPTLAFSPAGIGLGRAVSGVGAVALTVLQGKLIADRFSGRSFMPVMGMIVGAFPVGVGLVGLTRDWLVGAFGPAGLFAAGAVLPAVALALFLPSAHEDASPGARWALPSRRECGLVIVAGLVWTMYNAAYYGFLSYMPSLMAARHDTPALVAAVVMLATWPNLPATVLGGALAARVGTWPVFLAGTMLAITAVAGPAVLDQPLLWGILFGSVAAIHPGVIIAMGTLSTRPENRAVGMGLFYTTYYVGGTVLPALCGRAADVAGTPAGAMVAAAAISALSIPAFLLHRWMERRPIVRG